MTEAGHNDAIEIGEYLLERFTLRRRRARQHRLDVARGRRRHHRMVLHTFTVIRDPIDHRVAVAAELVWGHPRIITGTRETERQKAQGRMTG